MGDYLSVLAAARSVNARMLPPMVVFIEGVDDSQHKSHFPMPAPPFDLLFLLPTQRPFVVSTCSNSADPWILL